MNDTNQEIRQITVRADELMPNGLYWLWSKPKRRPCLMPRHGELAIVVFNNPDVARKYLLWSKQPIGNFAIHHTPLSKLANQLRGWLKEWNLLEWPAIRNDAYVSTTLRIADLLANYEKAVSELSEKPIEDGQHRHDRGTNP